MFAWRVTGNYAYSLLNYDSLILFANTPFNIKSTKCANFQEHVIQTIQKVLAKLRNLGKPKLSQEYIFVFKPVVTSVLVPQDSQYMGIVCIYNTGGAPPPPPPSFFRPDINLIGF